MKTKNRCIENNLAIISLMIAASFFVYGVDQYIKYYDTEVIMMESD